MLRVARIHSRVGNLLLGLFGALSTLAASLLLLYYLRETWGAASMFDRALQLMLVFAIAAGVIFATIARENLHGSQHAH